MRDSLKYMILALAVFAGVSCSEEINGPDFNDKEGREATVKLFLGAEPLSGSLDTRSLEDGISDNDPIINDVWIIEYNESGKIISVPKYYSKDDFSNEVVNVKVVLPPEGEKYVFVAIANTGNPDLEESLAEATTMDKLDDLYFKIESLSDTYKVKSVGKDGNTTKEAVLLMSDTLMVGSKPQNLTFRLRRNVAKLTLDIKVDTADVTVISCQVRNVPDRIFYADRLRDQNPETKYTDNPTPGMNEVSFIDYKLDKCRIEKASGVVSFSYYVPRNCRGIENKSNGHAFDKNNLSRTAGSTFVELMLVDKDGNPFRCRFYLGENMTNDFNVISNHHYTLPIVIKDLSSAGIDSRVDDMGSVILGKETGESNCYIINPMSNGIFQTFELPVHKRIDQYWKDVIGEDVFVSETEQAETEWVAEVIWQDAPRELIVFCDKDGNVATGDNIEEAPYVYNGVGRSSLYFKLKPNAEGNVLIGVRKKGAKKTEYLWSWHLWITDYAPDEQVGDWLDNVYEYPVTGGEVHRYDDGSSVTGNARVWSKSYKNKYIMDRNVGALVAEKEEGYDLYDITGFAYQFGRKDPFPLYTEKGKTLLYDIKAQPLTTMAGDVIISSTEKDYVYAIMAQVSIKQSVMNPHTFYYNELGTADWVESNEYTAEKWNNPPVYTEKAGITSGKSLFDPCPAGWMMPNSYVWSYLNKANVTGDYKNDFGWSIYISEYTNSEGERPKAFYSPAGVRQSKTGNVASSGTYGYYWSRDPQGTNNGYFLRILFSTNASSIKVTPRTSLYRSQGFPVRCVKE